MEDASRQRLLDWRRDKDGSFREAGSSPLAPEQLATFAGLRYFEPEASMRFEVRIEPFATPELVEMETSAGQPATYERHGLVRFSVDGVEQTLTVFRNPGEPFWFLPFRDATSGGETYGAGRYVELEPGSDDALILDFNYAYNPYCAYASHWVCPMPPAENRLSVAIRAGEQVFAEA